MPGDKHISKLLHGKISLVKIKQFHDKMKTHGVLYVLGCANKKSSRHTKT